MGFKPGTPKPKASGRKKGTPNKKSALLADLLEQHGIEPVSRLAKSLPNLEEDKQADIMLKLMDFLYPKKKAVEHSGANGGPIETHNTNVADKESVKQIVKAVLDERKT